MMKVFAERYIKMKESNPDISLFMPGNVETALYNTLYIYMENNKEVFGKLDKLAWTKLFNYRVNEYQEAFVKFGFNILDEINNGNCIYKFAIIDFLLQEIDNLKKIEEKDIPSFAEELNKEFERLKFGYRIISNHVAPITDPLEKEEIDKAINEVTDNVKEHLKDALKFLSDNKSPDYRNSVKESLSAVEAFCYKYTKKVTLTDSLKILDKKGVIHKNLKDAFDSLYYYSSSKNTGSRHGWAVDDDTFVPTYYEARFTLVTCSTFINYLKGKFGEDF